jgi:hypothetical protein
MTQKNFSNMPNPSDEDEGHLELNVANIQIGRLKPREGFYSYAGYQSYRFRDKKASIFDAFRYKHGETREKYKERKHAVEGFEDRRQLRCYDSFMDMGEDMDVDETNNPQEINAEHAPVRNTGKHI